MASMRWSLAASVLFHVAIVVAAIITLPSLSTYEVEELDSIPVEIVEIDEVSARQAVSKEVEEDLEEPPAPPKVEEPDRPTPAREPAREVEQAVREPEPEPIPELEPLEELIAAAAEPEPEPEAEPEPEPEQAEVRPVPLPKHKPTPPKRVAEKPKPAFSADEVAALLNKIDEANKAPPTASETGRPRQATFESLSGSDDRLAADLVDALRRRIESCWTLPAGARDAQDLRIRLKFALQPDGMVSQYPQIMNDSTHPAFDAAARSAQSAVKMCEPYNFLPPEKYDLWRDIILTFDPSRILALN